MSRRHVLMAGAAASVAALAIVATLLVARPSPRPVAHLVWDPNSSFAIVTPPMTGLATFGSVPLCTDRPGEVHIVSLTPVRASGIVFKGVATRPASRTLYGAGAKTLSEAGFPSSSDVGVTCAQAKTKGYVEMGAAFERTGTGPGKFASLEVNYLSSGKTLHLKIPWTLTVCPPKGTNC